MHKSSTLTLHLSHDWQVTLSFNQRSAQDNQLSSVVEHSRNANIKRKHDNNPIGHIHNELLCTTKLMQSDQ